MTQQNKWIYNYIMDITLSLSYCTLELEEVKQGGNCQYKVNTYPASEKIQLTV